MRTQEQVIQLIDSINKQFFNGIMAPSWYTFMDKILKENDFDLDVIYKLFKRCFDQNKLNQNYIKKVIETWRDAGVQTVEEADEYNEYWMKNYKKLKIITPNFTEKELKAIYHALLEVKNIENPMFLEIDEMEVIEKARKKIERKIF